MIKATVLKPFTTDLNELLLNGDVIFVQGTKVFLNRRFLGNMDYNKEQYLKVEQSYE